MGQYDWYVDADADVVWNESETVTKVQVDCDFVNNGWNYNMYMTGWVTCNGSEILVMSRKNVDTQGVSTDGGQVRLGSHTYSFTRGHSNYDVACSARIMSDGGYADGNKSSSTVYATIPAKPSYTVSYNANGGSGAPGAQTKWHGENLTLSSTRPTRAGHTFLGWATSASGAVAYQPGGTYTSNSAVTLYAKWQIHTWTVSYNANGGSGAPGAQTKTYGQTLTLSSTKPSRTGYTFKNWNTDSNGSGTAYNPGGSYTTNAAATLYAQWTINKYTVTFNTQGGSTVASQSVNYNSTATRPANPTKTGYNFKGWYTAATGGSVYDFNTKITGNKTIYAQWTLKTYNVTYNKNTSDTVDNMPSNQTKTHFTALKLDSNIPVRRRYNFLGWATSANGNVVYQPGGSYTNEANVTLYAVWELAASRVVVYDKDGNPEKGLVYFYDNDGIQHFGIVTVYDENGDARVVI